MRATDKAYTAGIIDGEGSISLVLINSKKTKTGRPSSAPKLVVQVTSTTKVLIEWLAATWGEGSVIPSYRPTRPQHQMAWGWRVRGPTAARVLREILPYLVIKRAQAELALKYQKTAVSSKKLGDAAMAVRMAARAEMLALNGTTHRARVWDAATT